MKTVHIYAGQPIGNNPPAKTEIRIEVPIPDYDFDNYPKAFQAQAEQLEKALHDSLPGGTYDRLCGLMLKRKSTHFIVSHEERIK